MQIYKLMRRKNNVKYYFAQNRTNSASGFILVDYSKIVPKKFEEIAVNLTYKKGKTPKIEYVEKHFPPCSKEVVDEIIKELLVY